MTDTEPSLVVECPFSDVYSLQYSHCSGTQQLARPCAGHSRYRFQFTDCTPYTSAHTAQRRTSRQGYYSTFQSTVSLTNETRSHPEMVGDMSRVTFNFDLSNIFVRF